MRSPKLLVEFLGTFFLTATIGLTALAPGGAGSLAPLGVGAMLIALVYAGGPISGAHYNPAVTLSVFLRGACPARDVAPYLAAQLLGASTAAGAVLLLKGNPPVAAADLDVARALLAEFLFTFALCYVILTVATAKATAGNSYYGVAIGLTVMAGGFAVGPISGAVFNPAMAVGATILGLSTPAGIWIFLAAEFAAGALAAPAYRWISREA